MKSVSTALLASIILYSGQTCAAGDIPTYTINLQTLPVERVLDARIEAVNQATVSAQTSGRVTEIFFDVDDYVETGDVLLSFRNKDQQARYKSAVASFKAAEASYNRALEIFKKDKQLISQSMMDTVESNMKSAEAAMVQAKEELENTQVKAPYPGIVVKRHIEVGELARVGQPLFTGISLQALRATVELPQDIVRSVRERQKASVILADGQRVDAASIRISPYADPASHTFNTRVNLPEGDYGVYPGSFVKVGFNINETEQLVIPVKAVVTRSEVNAVYVKKDAAWIMRHVRLGNKIGNDQVEVLAGVSAGEEIALDPLRATVALKQQEAE